LVADIDAQMTVTVRNLARVFGNVRARNLVVEEGAVIVGNVSVRAAA